MALKNYSFLFFVLFFLGEINAQNTLPTDSLKSESSFLSRLSIGGYGNAIYQRDFNLETATVNLERFVLFTGYKFNKNISFFSELEVEDAKVSGGEEGGEIALEQCYIKFNFNPDHYIVAGLFIPRLGIINENHLPTEYNGNERNRVETLVIPSTWRELGIGYYGNSSPLNLQWSLGIVNGLNSEGFEHGTGIREGRFEGREASANNLAVTGGIAYTKNDFKIQTSGYYGGSVGLAPRQADSLKLTSGIFGTPVILGEADVQYKWKGISAKLLGVMVSIPDASDLNRAYASNTPEAELGGYAELGYDIFHSNEKMKGKELTVFARYEMFDLNSTIPDNGIKDETLDQQHVVAGLSYLPVRNVIIKADVRLIHTGKENPDLIINPSPVAPPYEQDNTLFNLGIGYSF